ncbi:hypothetical protein [Natronorubrum daqingense]|uniref:DUF8151 domain-containing protein n=1 Tax=Natronorubrum daqingense TaxID=588898 RepID=A0A1N7EUZ5_9EURY|nr:hypothetical protein [Natronorubrum daqingense]APX97700.1 hypothetical protein BB347_14355 [Natronorubrum daqingense]SIR91896.1 hypothetical protein SAMN05421809_2882 [Natronorubrum daqingense]
MGSASPELLVEVLHLAVYTILASVLTIGGIAVEYTSVQYFGSGEVVVALWLAAIGCVMLYAGVYGIGYQKAMVQFRNLTR